MKRSKVTSRRKQPARPGNDTEIELTARVSKKSKITTAGLNIS